MAAKGKGKQRSAVSPAAAIASLASPTSPVVKDRWARVGFFANDSILDRLIGDGREFWAHMTSYESPDVVIDARAGWIETPLFPGVHADSRWFVTEDSWQIPPGVQRRPAAYLDREPCALIVELPCTADQQAVWLAALRGQIGQAYDKAGILSIALGRTKDPAWRGKHHPFFCDALGIWAAQQPRIIRRLMTPPYGRGPGAACDVCLATEGSRIVGYRGDIVGQFLEMAGFDLAEIPLLAAAS